MAEETGSASDDKAGIARTIAGVLKRLDPAFLGLLIVDALFIGGVIFLFHAQNVSRERVLGPILTSCMNSVPIDVLRIVINAKDGNGPIP